MGGADQSQKEQLAEVHPEIIQEALKRIQKQGVDTNKINARQARRAQALELLPLLFRKATSSTTLRSPLARSKKS